MRKVSIPVYATATITVRTTINLDIDDQTSDEEVRLLAEDTASTPGSHWTPLPDTLEHIRLISADRPEEQP